MEIRAAEVVIGCDPLDETLEFFTDQLGFRIDAILPADAPTTAVISGHGVRIRLDPGGGPPGVMRLRCADLDTLVAAESVLIAPNGTRIELVDADPALAIPNEASSFTVSRASDGAAWTVGRAGMHYRDLIPGRQGGRFIASHIRITEGGPVPDYVHHHRVRFQVICCVAGWISVVYEDQGPPFVLRAGDCVLQPPGIRHRVLESSAGAEVVEIGCPALHQTDADHDMALPTPEVRAERAFNGQRFVHHRADGAPWVPWRVDGFECQDTGIGSATGGLAGVRTVRSADSAPTTRFRHTAELAFAFVLDGALTVRLDDDPPLRLGKADAVVLPSGRTWSFLDATPDLELLDVTLPDVVELELVG